MNWGKVFAAAALCMALAAGARAAERKVWQIGEFDRSSHEFRSEGIDYADPASDPVFRVGTSKESDWYRFQPGPANGMTGGREHPFTILFPVEGTPRGVYRLKLAVMYVTPRLSYLKVDLNGHSGLFYFHPKLDYGGGDWEGTFVPQTSADTKTIEFPAEWLRPGQNKLVLTALDDPAKAENALGNIAPGQTGIAYDALELTQDPAARYDRSRVDVTAEPTIFYRQGPAGLEEVVDVYASCARLPKAGAVSLQVDGKTFTQKFTAMEEFGERKLEFSVPEWESTVRGEITIKGRSFPVQLAAAKKWTLFVIPHEHLDIGFTDYPEKVAELQSQSVDEAIAAAQRVPGFRWTLDGYWVAQQYMAGRSPEKQQEFLQALRDGRVVLPPEFANQHTGTASLEGLARSFYGSHEFAEKRHVPLGAAQIVDVPTYTWAYPTILHDAGIKYFLAASNNWRAPILLEGRWNEKSPFWWEGPDGGRVLMWYSRAYLQLHTLLGSPPSVAAARDSLPVFLQAYARPGYTASSAIIFGSQLENTRFSPEQATFPAAFNARYAWPKLEFSTVRDAMSEIEREIGDDHIPVVRGDFGPYWEDGFGSDAFATAVHRGNQQRIETAEKLALLPTLFDPAVRPDASLLKRAWQDVLRFDEHTWTYVGATTQPQSEQSVIQTALKRAQATGARQHIMEAMQRSWAQLEALVATKDNSVIVFNPLNWKRSGLVTLDLGDDREIVDSVTGKVVPCEVQWIGKGTHLPGFGPGYRRVRFVAGDIPALGYKVFTLRATKQPPAGVAPATRQDVIENRYYRVELDAESGAIKSILDKELHRELVDQSSPYRFGQYLYVTGGDNVPDNSLYRYGAALLPPKLEVHPAREGRIESVRRVPFGTVAVLDSSGVNTPAIRTQITLYDDEKKIDLSFHVRKDRVLSKEAAYFAFPIAAEHSDFAYGNQVGWVDPARDVLLGGSREWNTVTTWAAVRDPQFTAAIVPLDAPLVAFGDIVRGHWPERFQPVSSTIFSWVMNNYWGTNFVAWQGGEFNFRYTFFSEPAFDPAALTRRAMETLAPVESDTMAASFGPSRLPGTEAGLLDVEARDLALSTWKTADNGDGSILRLVETAGKAGTARIGSAFLRITRAWRCSLLEDNQQPMETNDGVLTLSYRPYEVITLRLRTEPVSAVAPGAKP
jgi:hypothetical protein